MPPFAGVSKHRAKVAGDPDGDKLTDAGAAPGLADPAFLAGESPAIPAQTPAPEPMDRKPTLASAAPVKHLTPTFVLDKKVDARSNEKASTQSKSPPTFVGNATKTADAWRYELASVESKGKIRIVYFLEDRYPAPTPTDDSGALSNVTKDNWKTITADLEANKEGVPDFWSAYRAEDVHEDYHWENEWQVEMKKELVKAEDGIAQLSLGLDEAADAGKVLASRAKTVFDTAMARADAAYQALPDTPGAPPFKAQIPVVTALKKRVENRAAANKW